MAFFLGEGGGVSVSESDGITMISTGARVKQDTIAGLGLYATWPGSYEAELPSLHLPAHLVLKDQHFACVWHPLAHTTFCISVCVLHPYTECIHFQLIDSTQNYSRISYYIIKRYNHFIQLGTKSYSD